MKQYKVYRVTNLEKFEGLCPVNWQEFLLRVTPYETRGLYDLKTGDLIRAYVSPCEKNKENNCNDKLCSGRLLTTNGVIYCQHFFEEAKEIIEETKKPARRIELNWE